MKTRLTSILVLAVALSASFSTSLNAAPKTARAEAVRVRTVDGNGWEISRGTPAQILINQFGRPKEKLSDNVWVYRKFRAMPDRPETRECDTLVVTLVGRKVTDLYLINDRAKTIITARLRSGAPAIVATAQ